MAICAKEMHKPVYVVAESFKFTRIFPLNQDDVPREFKVTTAHVSEVVISSRSVASVTLYVFLSVILKKNNSTPNLVYITLWQDLSMH